MRTIEIDGQVSPLASCAEEAQREPVVLTRDGVPFAVMLPVPNTDRETISLSTDPKFLAVIERSRESHRLHGGTASADVRSLLGMDSDTA